MTSDSDDLEQQLQQNLKLRRGLVAEVTKVRDRNAKDRLGWVLYWTFLALAVIWVFLWLWMLHGGFSDWKGLGLNRPSRYLGGTHLGNLLSWVSR
jgi:hypothetical protein